MTTLANRRSLIVFWLWIVAIPLGCEAPSVEAQQEMHEFVGATMGTSYSVRIVGEQKAEGDPLDLEAVQQKVDQRLAAINYFRMRPQESSAGATAKPFDTGTHGKVGVDR